MATFPYYKFNYINLSSQSHAKNIGFNWDFIEFLLSAPEYPIEDIINGQVVHRENLNKADVFYMSIVSELETGVIDFIKDVKKIFGVYADVTTDFQLKDVFSYYKYMWKNFNQEERNLLSQIEHPTDINQKKYINLLDKKVS